jgi:hypothetical protein
MQKLCSRRARENLGRLTFRESGRIAWRRPDLMRWRFLEDFQLMSETLGFVRRISNNSKNYINRKGNYEQLREESGCKHRLV